MLDERAPTYPWSMDAVPDPRRIAGALRFVVELSAVAAECARADAANDELTVRRRLRDEAAPVTTRRRAVRKAL
jgi:hypothetical protein